MIATNIGKKIITLVLAIALLMTSVVAFAESVETPAWKGTPNINTFATDLKEVIMKYEYRLTDVAATMSYVRDERKIYITVTGVIIDTQEKYKYDTTLKIWS